MSDFVGKPGRSGPPGNTNARKHGTNRVRTELKELQYLAMDGRTTEAHLVAEERSDLVASLGGDGGLSTQEQWLIAEAAITRMQLRRLNAWIARQPSLVNRRKRTVHPFVRDRITLVNHLAEMLGLLGLKRRTKDVDLGSYLAERSQTNGNGAAADATDEGQVEAAPDADAPASDDAGPHPEES